MKESGKNYFLNVFCSLLHVWHQKPFFTCTTKSTFIYWDENLFFPNRILALRKAEKEEEKRAREKIRQKLEEDKV